MEMKKNRGCDIRARSTRTSEKPQMILAPLEAFETNISNEPKELSSPPAQPKGQQPISQTPISVRSQWALGPRGMLKKALLTSGDMAGLLCPPAVRTLPLPSPILSPSRFPYSGRYKRGMASELRALQQPGLEY
eukprot:scaffold2961_cov118-Isochrysis_galbana.AAC.3